MTKLIIALDLLEMDQFEFGCDENKTKDDDSIISERCWTENYRGDSRKWLIRDGCTSHSQTKWLSTMKSTYPFPLKEELKHMSTYM